MSHMKQNKNRKQILKSVHCGLEVFDIYLDKKTVCFNVTMLFPLPAAYAILVKIKGLSRTAYREQKSLF